jgi:hypothetical protein
MLVLDVSNPAQPAEVGRFETWVGALDARDQLVFAGTSVISVTNPAQPGVIGSFAYHFTNFPPIFRFSADDVHVLNDLVYVTDSSGDQVQLFVFDVRDPVQPIPVGYFTTSGHAGTLWVDGNYVYVAGYDSPLLIIETPFNPQPVSLPALSLADGLAGFPWQPLQTVLLTNETSVIEVPSSSGMRFFRLRQLD